MSQIRFEINGVETVQFISAQVSKTINALSSSFQFTTTGIELGKLKVQDEVRVFIDDTLFLTGRIEKMNITSDSNSHTITVGGRDKLGDLVDSSIAPPSYKQRVFDKLLANVLRDNGFGDIKVLQDKESIPEQLVLEDKEIFRNTGETIAQFLDRYAGRVATLVTSTSEGNLLITRESSNTTQGSILREKDSQNNNVVSSMVEIDVTNRFQKITLYSQGDNYGYGRDSVAEQEKTAIDEEIIAPRTQRIQVADASTKLSLEEMAKWKVALRRSNGSKYHCRVQGLYTDPKTKELLWKPNTQVIIKDEICQVEGLFLIEGVTFTQSLNGTFADLTIVSRGTYSLGLNTANVDDFARNLMRREI